MSSVLKKAKTEHSEDREHGKKIARCGEIYTHVILKVWEAETEGLPQSGCCLSDIMFVSLPAAVIQNTLDKNNLRKRGFILAQRVQSWQGSHSSQRSTVNQRASWGMVPPTEGLPHPTNLIRSLSAYLS